MLTALPLELHAHIFSNLQPYDILQVSQTCHTLYRASSQRMVWTDALHRICVENVLFEPSFPVASMSVPDLQHASMGPHRWIARTSSKERNFEGVLPHSVTRHLMSAMSELSIDDLRSFVHNYLVPGGRYLFSLSYELLVLWDLGSPYSSGREPHSVAAVSVKSNYSCSNDFHLTPDGMGLTVLLLFDALEDVASAYIYEIYPENTSPQLTQIAFATIPDPDPDPDSESFYSLSYDHLILAQGNILTVWNYKDNTWARWRVEDREHIEIKTTKYAVMLIHPDGVSVWKIPPLLPESSFSMSTCPSFMPPVFELDYPENRFCDVHHQSPCGWYFGTSQPLYYDVEENLELYANSPRKINRFEIALNSKISGGTLNLLKTFEVQWNKRFSIDARFCQDKTVSLSTDSHTGFLETHVTDIYDQQLPPFILTPLSCHHIKLHNTTFCPVTGRVVYCETEWDSPPTIIVLDF